MKLRACGSPAWRQSIANLGSPGSSIFSNAVLPARLGICRRDAVSLDYERLFADGCDRMRHRQTAARSCGGQHPWRRRCQVPQPLGAHPLEDAEEGARQGRRLDPLSLPGRTADRARGTLRSLREDLTISGRRPGCDVPPCFIVVCNNTSASKLVYDFVSGFHRRMTTAQRPWKTDACSCFAISTSTATNSPGPNTLLIDSEQLESGEALDDNFRDDGEPTRLIVSVARSSNVPAIASRRRG